MKLIIPILFTGIVILGLGCTSNKVPAPQIGYEYFPIQSGIYGEFDVTKKIYAIGQDPQSIQYLQREMIGDSFKDVTGQIIYKVEFATQKAQQWNTDSIATIWKTTDEILGHENGDIIVRMIFPLADHNVWDGNQYNSKGERFFETTGVGIAYHTIKENFPETVTIVRQNDSTLVSKRRYVEVFAKGIGLIRRERTFVQYCNTPDCVGKGIINSGWEEISTLKSYGK
ncbi:hypothetical protein DYBT9275_00830 [Dyadobacter sp. CECT 9275]|uniref:Lipoprotein n=1 Tax=Dyadobacter helix TaxID=2822344 RepID=A0A916N2V4_9BACT|nr:hypothetical protein [Dyadobacter sp. CECT 9275]CAG4991783.1 hypothetical protein DYBT9275_00830 [Dyadobacter sp. CECT 9275]